MNYETSYDIGAKPFNHDKNRGKWESSQDFVFACVAHAFKQDIVTILPLMVFEMMGFYAVIYYFLILVVCIVPIVFIQSFLGQFSSTGFISVFRLAPLFKGIGYVSLIINFVTLTYYSIFSAIPLFFACKSLNSGLLNITKKDKYGFIKIPHTPELLYLNTTKPESDPDTIFSWQLIILNIFVWATVTLILCKSVKFIGKFIRYSFLIVILIMSVCLLRFSTLRGATKGMKEFFAPKYFSPGSLALVPVLALSTFGPGWGAILTMASYNDFKTNIFRSSWIVCLAQFGVITGMTFIVIFLRHFINVTEGHTGTFFEYEWHEFLIVGMGLTSLESPSFWSWLIFSMLALGAFDLLLVQLFSVLTSLFDEFENLREIKKHVICGTAVILSMVSSLYCCNHGAFLFEILSKLSILVQAILNLLLLLVVLWVYGRERFQRDLKFMTSQIYPTWMVYIVRFVAPVILIVGIVIGFIWFGLSLIFHDREHYYGLIFILIAFLGYLILLCSIVSYCFVKIKDVTGGFCTRVKRCLRPTDWYPADPVDKQSYEERFSTTDASYPLAIVEEE